MMQDLPPEIIHMILEYIMYGPKVQLNLSRSADFSHMVMGIAHEAPIYATVSRTWQDIIERKTFRELRVDLDRLRQWGSIMTPRRCGYVSLLHLDIVLPRYFDAACGQVETEEEQRQNSLIATATVKEFVGQLSTCKKEDLPAGHILEVWVQSYSPSDEGHWTREEWEDRRAWPRPKWPQIYEKRYDNSVLELIDLDTSNLPEVFAITHINNNQRSGRHIAPALVCALTGRLRNARKTRFLAWDDPTESSTRRHRIRTDYARAVQDVVVLPEYLWLIHCLEKSKFEDHSAQPPIFTPQGTEDPLSIGLRGLSQRAKRIVLSSIIIGDEFFWPSADQNPNPHWPHLWSITLNLRLSTPDGRWRFDYAEPESQSESDSDSSDYEHINQLRRQANPGLMNKLYLSAARAAMEMPKLELMRLNAVGWKFQDITFHFFIYKVNDSRPTATWYSYPPFQPDEDVMQFWEQVGLKYHGTATGIFFSEERPSYQ